MDDIDWNINLKMAHARMKLWQREYVKKLRLKNPKISIEELNKKINKAQAIKFKELDDMIINRLNTIQKQNENT